MQVIKLTKESNEIQRVVTLKNNRNKRHKYREFVVEGHASIDEAYKMQWKIKALFYNKDVKLSRWASHYLDSKQYEIAYAVSQEIMDKISDKSESSELIAIVEKQNRLFANYKMQPNDVIVVLDEPKSPGNVGMIIRSAAAFGASAIIISGHGADEYDPQCIRASVGTFFSMPIYQVEGIEQFAKKIQNLRQNLEVSIVASGDKGSIALEEAIFTHGALVLVLGNETQGISYGYKQIADQFVKISMPTRFTSLNIAAAGSIFLYEIFKQRARIGTE